MTISTMAQLAAAVGAPPPPGAPVARDAGDVIALLDAWVAHLRGFSWEFLSAASPSRGRTLRELTVNVFSPFDLLPTAWESGEFPWHPEDDEARGAAFAGHAELVDWAADVARQWARFVAVEQDGFETGRQLLSPRGRLAWGPLLASQRWHAAFHYRQLVHFADREGVGRPRGVLELESLRDLALPDDVF
jgi:hypothetical protein